MNAPNYAFDVISYAMFTVRDHLEQCAVKWMQIQLRIWIAQPIFYALLFCQWWKSNSNASANAQRSLFLFCLWCTLKHIIQIMSAEPNSNNRTECYRAMVSQFHFKYENSCHTINCMLFDRCRLCGDKSFGVGFIVPYNLIFHYGYSDNVIARVQVINAHSNMIFHTILYAIDGFLVKIHHK